MPAFVLEACTVRARQELFGYKGIPRRSKGKNMFLERCRRFMEQVGMGLEYIHCKGLVHMELSLDTVMVSLGQWGNNTFISIHFGLLYSYLVPYSDGTIIDLF